MTVTKLPLQVSPSQPDLHVQLPLYRSHPESQPTPQVSLHNSPYLLSTQWVQTPESLLHPCLQVSMHVWLQYIPNVPTGHIPSHAPVSLWHLTKQLEQTLLQKLPPNRPLTQLLHAPEILSHPPWQFWLHGLLQCVPYLPTLHAPVHAPVSLIQFPRQPVQVLLQESP